MDPAAGGMPAARLIQPDFLGGRFLVAWLEDTSPRGLDDSVIIEATCLRCLREGALPVFGFSEELLKDHSSDPRLHVVARTSAFAFKGRKEDVRTIAHALHVGAVVEGSVRETGNRVRVDAQLIDASSGYQMWSASFDRDSSNILAVQDEIARAIAPSLTQKLLPATFREQHRHSTVVNVEAYRAYLLAQSNLASHAPEGARMAIPLLKTATTLEPDFPDAFAALGLSYIILAVNGLRFEESGRWARWSPCLLRSSLPSWATRHRLPGHVSRPSINQQARTETVCNVLNKQLRALQVIRRCCSRTTRGHLMLCYD